MLNIQEDLSLLYFQSLQGAVFFEYRYEVVEQECRVPERIYMHGMIRICLQSATKLRITELSRDYILTFVNIILPVQVKDKVHKVFLLLSHVSSFLKRSKSLLEYQLWRDEILQAFIFRMLASILNYEIGRAHV